MGVAGGGCHRQGRGVTQRGCVAKGGGVSHWHIVTLVGVAVVGEENVGVGGRQG